MKHRFIYDTAEDTLGFSPWSRRKLAQYHYRRRERLHKTLFPFLVIGLIIALKFAANTFGF